MTRARGIDRLPTWLRRWFPHRDTPGRPAPDPLIPTSRHPIEQVRLRLGSGEWKPGSDLLPTKPRRESPTPVPGNRARFPTGRVSGAQPANQRLYPT